MLAVPGTREVVDREEFPREPGADWLARQRDVGDGDRREQALSGEGDRAAAPGQFAAEWLQHPCFDVLDGEVERLGPGHLVLAVHGWLMST